MHIIVYLVQSPNPPHFLVLWVRHSGIVRFFYLVFY